MSRSPRRQLVAFALVLVLGLGGAMWYLAEEPASRAGTPAAAAEAPVSKPASTVEAPTAPVAGAVAPASSQKPTLTPEEKAKVAARIAEARKEVQRLKIQNRTLVPGPEDEWSRAELAQVEPFTDAQVDAFYTYLSQQGREFAPGSATAVEFRKQADGLVYSLRKYPRMAVSKTTDKKSGVPSFVVYELSEGAAFPTVEGKSIAVRGKHKTRILTDHTLDPELEGFFASVPDGK